MKHRTFVHVTSEDELRQIAKDTNADTWMCAPCTPTPSGRIVGWITGGERNTLRNHPKAKVMPPPHSAMDATQLAKDLGFPKAKTVYDVHTELFTLTNMDMFDPDL